MTNEGICIDSLTKSSEDHNDSLVRIVTCARTNRQRWMYNIKSQQIVQNAESKCCLTGAALVADEFERVHTDVNKLDNFNLTLSPCAVNKFQRWVFLPLKWKDFDK